MKDGDILVQRVNIGLPEKLHQQAKVIATLKKIPLGKFLELAIKQAVDKDKKVLEELFK